jgi:hypothetical protein
MSILLSSENFAKLFNISYLRENYENIYNDLIELYSATDQLYFSFNSNDKSTKKLNKQITCECGEVKSVINKQHLEGKRHREWLLDNNPDYVPEIVKHVPTITCECGSNLTKISAKHLKSKKHTKWVQSNVQSEQDNESDPEFKQDNESDQEDNTHEAKIEPKIVKNVKSKQTVKKVDKTKEKVMCECGESFTRITKSHLESKKHLESVAILQDNDEYIDQENDQDLLEDSKDSDNNDF